MLFWCILCVCCCDGLDRGVETVCIGVCVCVLSQHHRGGSAQTVWSCLVGVRNSTFHSVTRCEQLSVSLNVYGNHNLLMTTLIVFNAGRSVEWCDTFCLLHRKTTQFPSIIYIEFYFIFYPHRRSFFHCFYRERKGNREISMWERAAPSWPKYTCHQLRTVWNFIIRDLFWGKSFSSVFYMDGRRPGMRMALSKSLH